MPTHDSSKELAELTERLRTANARLNAMVELSHDLALELDLSRLLDSFCRAAREIVGARYAAIGIVARSGELIHFLTSGLNLEAQRLGPPNLQASALAALLNRQCTQNLGGLNGSREETGLPEQFPPAQSFLGATIASFGGIYGWVALIDKLGADAFSADDVRLASTLAAQLGRSYENGSLYAELKRHTAELDQEIAQRKRREEELRDSEERLRQIAEHIHEFFFLVDPFMTQTFYISPAYEKIWGRSCASLYANAESWSDAIHPEDRERIFKAIKHDGALVPFDLEHRIVRPDGSVRWVRARAFPIHDNAGAIYRFAGIVEDITERKTAEIAIAGKELQYRRLFEAAKDGILILDASTGRITDCNSFLATLLGYSLDELLGKELWEIGTFEKIVASKAAFHELQEKEYVRFDDMPLKTSDGRQVEVEFVSNSYWVNDTRVIQCNIRDISDRRKLETQLRQAMKMEAIGQLAGGIAHDFNNLLTIINGRSQLMMKHVKPGEKMHNDLELIYRTGERAATLTRQLLAFSRQQVLQPVTLDLNAVAVEMDRLLRRLVPENIEIHTALEPALKRVRADPGQIEQIIMNLAVNARDAMPNGGKLTIETNNVELSTEYCRTRPDIEPGPFVMLAVTDNGHGMSETVKSRIFEPFFTTKPQGKGTGLGLATVFGVVKQSNGHIEVYSEVGKGTTFKIYLAQSPEQPKTLSSSSLAAVAGGQETILVVEDEEGVRDLVRDLLQMNGYSVLVAGNGIEALKICEQHHDIIDLVLTDVVMPEMGGPEFVKRLKESHSETRVLYTSGYTDHAIVHNGELEAGVAFIQKPFTPVNLARKVREVLDQAE